jgi:uncharacterized membrane protein YcaP (DUF421 family)
MANLEWLALQIAKALLYYVALVVLVRAAGKRLAGRTTTFDLLVLIAMGVALQGATLEPGIVPALVFVATVFAAHKALSFGCSRWTPVRHFVRGKPRVLVQDGRILDHALRDEGISREELEAGLRKAGYEDPASVKRAVLEETGEVSAIGNGG